MKFNASDGNCVFSMMARYHIAKIIATRRQ